jgi:hypothetical protein
MQVHWYVLGSFVLSIILASFNVVDVGNGEEGGNKKLPITSNTAFLVSFTVFCLTAIAYIAFAWGRLSKPGILAEVHSLILKRHVSTLIVFFIGNHYVFVEKCWF